MLSIDVAIGIGALALASMAQPAPPPVAQDDPVVVAADAVATGSLLANDSSVRGGLRVAAVDGGAVGAPFASPRGATVRIEADGRFSYDPAGAFAALARAATVEERIGYQVTDGVEGAAAALVVRVVGVNAPPVAAGALPDLDFEQGVAVAPFSVAGDFSDPGDMLAYRGLGLPAGLTLDGAGVVSGTPSATASGAVVRVIAEDSAGQTAESAFQISVRAPAARGPALTTPPGAQAWRTGVPASLSLRAAFDETGANPVVSHFLMGPGSDALPAGLALDPTTGAVTGTPAAPSLAGLTLRFLAVAAGTGETTEATVPVTVADARPELLVGAPVNGASVAPAGAITAIPGGYRITRATGAQTALVGWSLGGLVVGQRYELRGVVRATDGAMEFDALALRFTDQANLAAFTGANGAGLSVANATANDKSLEPVVWTATRSTIFVAVGGFDAAILGPSASIDVLGLSVKVHVPRPLAAPAAAAPRDVVLPLGAAASVDLTALPALVANAAELFVAPESAPLPRGVYLTGQSLAGVPAEAGETEVSLGVRNGQGRSTGEGGLAVRATARIVVATVLPEKVGATPLLAVGAPAAVPLAGLFDFTPDRIAVDAAQTAPATVAGWAGIAGTALEGLPNRHADPAGEDLWLIGRDATRWQRLRLRVFVRTPVEAPANLTTGLPTSYDPATGNAYPANVLRIERIGGRTRVTNVSGGQLNMPSVYWSLGSNTTGAQFEARLGFRASYAWGNQFSDQNLRSILLYYTANLGDANRGMTSLGAYSDTPANSKTHQLFAPLTDVGVVTTPTSAGGQMYLGVQMRYMPPGGYVEFVEHGCYDRKAVDPVYLGSLFDETAMVARAGLEPWAAPLALDLGQHFWPPESVVSLASGALQGGLVLDGRILAGKATEAAARTLTVRATNNGRSRDASFTLTTATGAALYTGAPDAFIPARRFGVESRVRRTGAASWAVSQVSGQAEILFRLNETVAGTRYRMTLAYDRGSIPAGTQMSARAGRNMYALAPVASWLAGDPAPAIEFTAEEDLPWVAVGVTAAPGQTWLLTGVPAVAPASAADAAPPDGGHVVGDLVTGAGYVARRVHNLRYGMLYDLTASAPGASRIKLRRNPADDLAPAGFPALPGVTDAWAGPSAADRFVAQFETLWLVAEGATSLTAEVALRGYVWPPAAVAPAAGAIYPFLTAYPPVPAGAIAIPNGTNLAAFLNGPAADGATYVLAAGGVYGGGTVTRRFTQGVTVMAPTRYGATASALALSGARRLTLRGLHVNEDNLWALPHAQEIGFEHMLFRGGAGVTTDEDRPAFHLRVDDCDFMGGPIGGSTVVAGRTLTPDYRTNPAGKVLGLENAIWTRVRGGRIWGTRDDPIKATGQFIEFQNHLAGEMFSYVTSDMDGKDGDHPDILQAFYKFDDPTKGRGPKWWSFRRVAWFDNLAGTTGGYNAAGQTGPGASNVNDGTTTTIGLGNQHHGPVSMHIEDSFLHVFSPPRDKNVYVNDVVRDYKVVGNYITGAKLHYGGSSIGRYAGEVRNNVAIAIEDIPVDSGQIFSIADKSLVRGRSENLGYQAAGVSAAALFTLPSTLWGMTPRADGPLLTGTVGGVSHVGRGATGLAAILAAVAAAAPAAPEPGMWEASSPGAGTLRVVLRTLPHGSDTRAPAFDVSLDNGASWIALTAITPPMVWEQTLTGLAAGPRQVRLRVRATLAGFAGASAASAARTVTVD